MIRLGLALRGNFEPRHIYVVLSDPGQTGGQILFVNFTSQLSGIDDQTEIFNHGDYWILRHQSVIAFWGAQDGPATRLQLAIDREQFTPLPDLPTETLQRMIRAARTSTDLSAARKRLLPPDA
jgi:hypothetical protein